MWVNGKAKEPAPRNSSGTQTARRTFFVPQGNRRYSGNGEVKGAGRRPAVREATAKKGTDAAMIAKHSWRVDLGHRRHFSLAACRRTSATRFV
jgi:hypothetical protein